MDLDALRDGIDQAWTTVAAFTPKLAAALVILLIGWLVAKLARTVTTRLLTTLRFDEAVARTGVTAAADSSGYDPTGLVAGVVGWWLLFVTFQLAAETLGASALSTLLADLVGFVPLVLVAAAIVMVAAAFGQFVAGAIATNLGARGAVGARLAYWSIVAFGAVAALNVVNVAESVVNAVFYAVLGTLALSAVIAFGVGGIPVARDLTSRWVARAGRDVTLYGVTDETSVAS